MIVWAGRSSCQSYWGHVHGAGLCLGRGAPLPWFALRFKPATLLLLLLRPYPRSEELRADGTCSHPAPPETIRYKGYTLTTYGKISWKSDHDDGEVYAAAMWRVLELYQAAGFTSKDLLYDWVQGMAYTQGNPRFEDMRNGMLEHLAASQSKGATTTRTCAVWRGFAQFGVGIRANANTAVNPISVAESFDMPDECLLGPPPKSGGAGLRAEGATDGGGGPAAPLFGAEVAPSSGDADMGP